MKPAASVAEYLAAVPPEQRAALERLRKTIKAAAPKATEAITYRMPTFKENGRSLVSYAAFKDHCSLFPMSMAVIEDNIDQLGPYRSGKGTIRFTQEHPLPVALIKKIVRARQKEIAARRAR